MKSKHKQAIERELPNILSKVSAPLSDKLSFEAQIENQINGFDLKDIEKIANEVLGRELKEIERLGALIGFLVGLMQLCVLLLL